MSSAREIGVHGALVVDAAAAHAYPNSFYRIRAAYSSGMAESNYELRERSLMLFALAPDRFPGRSL